VSSRLPCSQRNRRRIFVALGLTGTLAALVGFLARSSEPSYHGHSLSEWIVPLSLENDVPPAFRWSQGEASEALRQMGTNSFPFLLKWFTYTPTRRVKHFVWLATSRHMPWLYRYRSFNDWMYRHDINHTKIHAAVRACHVLGPLAAPLIPALSRMAVTNRNFAQQGYVIDAIAGIGRAALPILTKLANSDCDVTQCRALNDLKHLGTNALPLVPLLLAKLKSTNEMVAAESAATLGYLRFEPAKVVPALAECVQTTNETLRTWALGALGSYGAEARSTLPLLLEKLQDSDWFTKQYVSMAIKEIAPEVLTNASPE